MERLVRGHSHRNALWLAAMATCLVVVLGWSSGVPSGTTHDAAAAGQPASPAPRASGHSSRATAAGTLLFRALPPSPGTPPSTVPVALDRSAAQAAATRGSLDIELPDGTRYPVRHERSEAMPDGSWTFVGRVATPLGALASVLTFGTDGSVFGTLPTPGGDLLKLTTRGGQAYLQPAGWMVPPGADPSRHLDYVAPEPGTTQPATAGPATAAAAGMSRAAAMVDQGMGTAEGPVTITILAVYTRNLAQLRGSTAAAQAEYHNLVAVMNQAHIDSGTRARFQVAGFTMVDYPAGATNAEARADIIANTLPDGTNLRALRDARAADLVAMIRPYVTDDLTCGISQFPGAPLSPHDLDPETGYSVTAVEACTPLVFAHELGHSLGLMHDRETIAGPHGATLSYGAYPFSFGHRQLGPPGFATVMAYDSSSRPRLGLFSHSGTALCGGVACGDATLADNVRSVNLLAGSIARFRDAPNAIAISDAWAGESEGRATVHVRLSSPAPGGGITFDLAFEPGPATHGVDFEPWNAATLQDIVIPPGATSASVELRIFDDDAPEPTETAGIRLQDVRGAVTVLDDQATLGIVDDDRTVRVSGTMRFPPGHGASASPAHVVAKVVKDGVGYSRVAAVSAPLYDYAFDVPEGAHVSIQASHPSLRTQAVVIEDVAAPMAGIDLRMKTPVTLSGTLRAPSGQQVHGVPMILWNGEGDGSGEYPNWSGYSFIASYGTSVLPGVAMQLEVRDPPAPYVRQVVELPPLSANASRQIQLRTVPSLTIPHVSVLEGDMADGNRTVLLTAGLSVPGSETGVAFDLQVAGPAIASDYTLPGTRITIPKGYTRAEIPIVIRGDDLHEQDETIELQVTNLTGAAWNPGPGSLRIVDDDPAPLRGSRCRGDGPVRMCD